MNTPRGHGPWFVALLWNTSASLKSKKQTEIVIHTYPHLFANFYNQKDANSFWVILMKIGPFEEWTKCVAFFNQWSQKTRNRVARIEKGIMLHQKFELTLWIQTKDKETIKKEYEDYQSSKCSKLSDEMRIYELRKIIVSNK